MEDLDPVVDDGAQDTDKDPYVKTDLEILDDDDKGTVETTVEDKPESKPPVETEERKPKPAKEDEEEEEEEPEDEEEDEEEVDIPAESPEYRDVKKKYPNLFKDFPGLRHDFFRVKAYDKVFSSVDEAREVADRYDGLVEVERIISTGDTPKLLTGLAQYSKPALRRLATDFLPVLNQVDKEVHDKIAGDLVARVLRAAQQQGKSSGNKNLFHAASHLSMFVFSKENPPDEAPVTSPEIEEQKQQLEARERQFFESRNSEFTQDVKTTGERQLRREVARGLDPDDVLPDFVKESILDRTLEEVDSAMGEDEQHIRNMNTLWEKAARMGHGKDFKNRLIQQYILRARSLVGPIRRKLVKDAIGKINKKPGEGGKKIAGKSIPEGGVSRAGTKAPSSKDVDWSKTSDLDYLNRKIQTRK